MCVPSGAAPEPPFFVSILIERAGYEPPFGFTEDFPGFDPSPNCLKI
jgi:hypothetical protein